jgi:exonuclease SbcC
MHISIKNFKGWVSKEVDFPDDGITLLSAVSGAGKSSILEAISFAVTGNASGKLKNLNGDGNPKVILKFGCMEIMRSRAPNILRVKIDDETYENAEAQNYIDDMFTTHFTKIGYIRQKGVAAFLEMSGPAKMEFLQDWVLSDPSINELKSSAKELAKTKKSEYSTSEIKLNVESEYFENLSKPEEVDNPFEGYEDDEQTVYNTWIKEYKRSSKLAEKCGAKRSELNEELKDAKRREKYERIKESAETQLKDVKKQLEEASIGNPKSVKLELDIRSVKSSLKISEDSVESLNEEIDAYTIDYDLDELQTEIDEMERSLEIKKTVDKLQDKIGEHEKSKTVKAELTKALELRDDFKEVEEYSEEEENELKSRSKGMSCPGCGMKLSIQENELVHTGETSKDEKRLKKLMKLKEMKRVLEGETEPTDGEIEELRAKSKAQRYISELEEYLEEAGEYNSEITKDELEDKKNDLAATLKQQAGKDYLTKSLSDQKKNVKKLRARLEELLTSLAEHELQGLLTKYQTLDDVRTTKKNLVKRITDANDVLETIETKRSSEEVSSEIDENNETHEEALNNMKEMSELKLKVKMYHDFLKQRQSWLKHKKQVGKAKVAKSEAEWNYKQAKKLTEIISKLEAERIQGFISSLNKSIQKYCDDFFVEEPLTIQLNCFKETKGTKKAQITFNISYKEYECNDLGILSGGEYDRLQLAVCLAFADISQTPLLMLDESLASLDETTCESVVTSLSDSGRLTILVAHQVSSEGVFDKIVKL